MRATVYNPKSNSGMVLVHMKVPDLQFDIIDVSNQRVYGEVYCLNKTDSNDCDLYFQYLMAPYSLNHFKLVPAPKASKTAYVKKEKLPIFFLSKTYQLTDRKKITLSKFSRKIIYDYCTAQQCFYEQFSINYNYYEPAQEMFKVQSDPYVFRPSKLTQGGPLPYNTVDSRYIYQGKLLTILLYEGNRVETQIKFYHLGDDYDNVIEVQSYLDSVPVHLYGKEIVMDVDCDVRNGKVFYTDANGLELQKRQLNYRPTWDLSTTEHISSNYYPVTQMIAISDKVNFKSVAVLNDRAQGGSSLNEGQIELMIQRRLQKRNFKVEALNERENYNNRIGLRAKMKHWIVFYSNFSNAKLPRQVQQNNDQKPVTYLSYTKTATFSYYNEKPQIANFMQMQIPRLMKFYLQDMGNNNFIMRLHNMDE